MKTICAGSGPAGRAMPWLHWFFLVPLAMGRLAGGEEAGSGADSADAPSPSALAAPRTEGIRRLLGASPPPGAAPGAPAPVYFDPAAQHAGMAGGGALKPEMFVLESDERPEKKIKSGPGSVPAPLTYLKAKAGVVDNEFRAWSSVRFSVENANGALREYSVKCSCGLGAATETGRLDHFPLEPAKFHEHGLGEHEFQLFRGGVALPHPKIKVNFVVVDITLRGVGLVGDKTTDVYAGMPIALSPYTIPSNLLGEEPVVRWSVGGTPLTDWGYVYETEAVPNPADPQKPGRRMVRTHAEKTALADEAKAAARVAFFYYQKGRFPVTMTVTLPDGQTITMTAMIHSVKPDVGIEIDPYEVVSFFMKGGTSWYRKFAEDPITGNLENIGPGIRWRVTGMPMQVVPGGRCEYQWLQITTSRREWNIARGGGMFERHAVGVLDTKPNISTVVPWYNLGFAVPDSNGDYYYEGEDSPIFSAPAAGDRYGVDDRFECFLMYRPRVLVDGQEGEGSHWVPLRKFKWEWGSTARRSADEELWQQTSRAFTPRTRKDEEAEEYPDWTTHILLVEPKAKE